MANILQVTPPGLNTDNRTLSTGQEAKHAADSQLIQNPVDLSRVTRADGREDGKTEDAASEGSYNIIDYGSNYGAFVKSLSENQELSALLERLLFTDLAGAGKLGQAEIGALLDQLAAAITMDSPEGLLEFITGQAKSQTRFGSAFFDGLRMLLAEGNSGYLKDTALEFLKAYNSYSSGAHFLEQIRALGEDISQLMLRQYKGEFKELLQQMNWNAAEGDTAANGALLNSRLIPFLSSYIARTHDYGGVRDAAMLLIMNAVRYEGGSEERLTRLLGEMAADGSFSRIFKGDPEELLAQLLREGTRAYQSSRGGFAGELSALLEKGAGGQAGLENIQHFYTAINGLLVNESVFMPLLHLIIPFRYEGENVVSEMWVDPDGKRENSEEGRRIKMFLKFDIKSLGKFEMIMTIVNGEADVSLYVPQGLAGKGRQIESEVGGILKKNGISFQHLLIGRCVRDSRVEEVFPEIREKERGINVRI
ncbi:MAG: hypothetical protein LIP16_05695 [Clostridium sp.]|nr:hypothetical protein [Clostridium sp.]